MTHVDHLDSVIRQHGAVVFDLNQGIMGTVKLFALDNNQSDIVAL